MLKTGMKGPFRAQDLAEVWYGSERMDLAKLEAFKAMLDGEQPSFEIEYRRPYLYHAAGDEDAEAASGPMEVNEARARMLSSFRQRRGFSSAAPIRKPGFTNCLSFSGCDCGTLRRSNPRVGDGNKVEDTPSGNAPTRGGSQKQPSTFSPVA